VLPERRTVVQDGGHFVGWAPMYWRIPRPQDLVMVGTAYQAIGLGLASAVGAARAVEDGRTLVLASGDGGFLMGLSDLESLIGAASSAVVVIYNDAAYGAEIHQYGSQGLTEKPMLIPEVDFSGVARALGAESAIIRSLADLSALTDWIDAGARGTFVADCRITSSVRAPWLSEWMQASQAAKAAVAG
jgi:thiamine pyrophosphate-dependent acetolactate synthase large subunit-like protein